MKNIFGIHKGTNKSDGSVFVVRSVDTEQQESMSQTATDGYELEKKASLPGWLSVIKGICAFLFAIVALSTLKAGFKAAWNNAAWLLVCGGICGIVALVLFIVGKIKEKKTEPKADAFIERANTDEEISKQQLNIPATALPTDILSFLYKEKNGKIKICTSVFSEYILTPVYAFFENGNLCFADLNDVYAIPVSEIISIEQRKKRTTAMGWNKMQPPTDKYFKRYKISTNAYGTVFMKPYAVTVRHGEQDFEFFLPPYEIEKICSLCGLPLPIG